MENYVVIIDISSLEMKILRKLGNPIFTSMDCRRNNSLAFKGHFIFHIGVRFMNDFSAPYEKILAILGNFCITTPVMAICKRDVSLDFFKYLSRRLPFTPTRFKVIHRRNTWPILLFIIAWKH